MVTERTKVISVADEKSWTHNTDTSDEEMEIIRQARTLLRKSKFAREQYCNYLTLKSYFDESLVEKDNLHWLFILAFPNGGSTAVAKLLLTSPSVQSLTGNAEGQWLIPSLSKRGRRWDRNYDISHRKLRAVWLNQVKISPVAETLIVEKSPPNMVRYKSILSAFKAMKTSLITLSRDPYATCASWHRRYGPKVIVRNWYPSAKRKVNSEDDYFRLLGDIWCERARCLLDAREYSVCNIRYEDFADNTEDTIANLASLIPQIDHVSSTAQVKVKDYEAQGIQNMNERQIKTLTNDQIEAITSALSESPSIVEKLQYSIRL